MLGLVIVSVTVAIVAPCWERRRLDGAGRRGEMENFFLSARGGDEADDVLFAEL